jgi:EPS-associated MarR family transcriptional regulator
MGMRLGKVNYRLRGLIDTGWVKAATFKNSRNKSAYIYLLTPRDLEQRVWITTRSLQIKMREYEAFKDEFEQIRIEAARSHR